jgi:hypothetical protein
VFPAGEFITRGQTDSLSYWENFGEKITARIGRSTIDFFKWHPGSESQTRRN